MKHTRARNVTKSTFRLMKMRWGILRCPSWYSIKTVNQIIMVCCLIHNYIRKEMVVDPLEGGLDEYLSNQPFEDAYNNIEVVDLLDTTPKWTTLRDNMGWKSENGSKAGFLQELEKGMRKKLPGTDIVVNPHINSKIHVWKKEYGVFSDFLSKSGIKWNSTTSMIEVENEGLIEIFWKDRATGENVVDPIDLANDLYMNGMEQDGENMEKYIPLTLDGIQDIEGNSTSKPIDSKMKALPKGPPDIDICRLKRLDICK
ncbi:hypothetical protein ACS0TY_020681 [Phlomoides rotata]